MQAVASPRTFFLPIESFISADDFLKMSNSPEYADCRMELVEGRIVEMSHPKPIHAIVATELGFALKLHVTKHGLGIVFSHELGFVLERRPIGRDTVRGIDISFLSTERTSGLLPDSWFEGAPDLAVEVMSPSNTVSDINLKIRQLLEAGAQAVWVVDPVTRAVHVHTAQGIRVFNENDSLSGGEVLPGFRIPVADIFPA